MKIEVGKTYRTRGGITVECVVDDASTNFPAAYRLPSGGRHWVTREGKSCIGYDDYDLVSHVADPLDAIRHDIRKLRIGGWFNSIAIIVLAILAILFSTRANAADIAEMPNAAGGEITLTSDKGSCPDLYLLAYSRGYDGTVITGCWLPGTRYVLIKWSESGEVKLFAYDQFTPLVRQVPAKRGTSL